MDAKRDYRSQPIVLDHQDLLPWSTGTPPIAPRLCKIGRSVLMQWILPGLMIVVDHGYNPQIAWSIPTVTVAIDPRDAICYMEMADGRIIDLSRVCGGRETRLVSLSPVDQQFLDNYQDALRRQYNQLPAAQTALTQVQQNPQSVLQRAQQVCTSVRNGMSPELALLGEGQVDSALINDLALNHYCPDVND